MVGWLRLDDTDMDYLSRVYSYVSFKTVLTLREL